MPEAAASVGVAGPTVQNGNRYGRPGTSCALDLRYFPRSLGTQSATITIYHDGNDEGMTRITVSGEAFWDTKVELRGNGPYEPIGAPVANFGQVKRGSAPITKNVYLK